MSMAVPAFDPRNMSDDDLAKVIAEAMLEHSTGFSMVGIASETMTDISIDGNFDLVAVARVVRAALGAPQ